MALALHKEMILNNPAESTCITSAFTGKPVRSFNNEFIKTTEQQFSESMIPSYPMQHYLTKELRRYASQIQQMNCSGLWSGQGNPLGRTGSVRALIKALEHETVAALSQFK